METLEMPVAEDLEQSTGWSDKPPVKFEEQEMDIAAFELWRTASMPDLTVEEQSE
jgi:hypothetical protein